MYLFDAVVPEQAMADAVIGNESVPIQLGWPFPVLKCKCIFSNKIHGNNFIKQHSETVMTIEITKMLIAI